MSNGKFVVSPPVEHGFQIIESTPGNGTERTARSPRSHRPTLWVVAC
jgi:hypothetical protein